MSNFCVINDAEEFAEWLADELPRPWTEEQHRMLGELYRIMGEGEHEARVFEEDIDRLEEALESETAKVDKLDEEPTELKEEMEELKTELKEAEEKTDWRLSDNPFGQWYKEYIHA